MEAPEHPYAHVARELHGTAFASIRYARETTSTNDDAAALLGDESAYGTTIVAEHQTHGAGRKGRSWIAQPGTSLLFTTILPRPLAATNLWIAPFATAVAIRNALAKHAIPTTLHWPNDLLLHGKKIAGILCISRIVGERAWVAAGIGINVTRTPHAAEGIDPPPAFCDDVAPVDRAALLRDILLSFDVWQDELDLPARIARVWERQAELPGVRYRILKDGAEAPIDVTALGLAYGGGLLVRHDDGPRETIELADARALR